MSEIGEVFSALKAQKKIKKANNLQSSWELLKQHGVEFKEFNGRVHLVVETKAGTVDFWPTTGKFRIRTTGKSGRGVFKLLKLCRK